MILAGDIGGTKTNLALYDWPTERVEPVRLETFHSADYKSLEEILEEFLTPPKPPMLLDDIEVAASGEEEAEVESFPEEPIKLTAACFGVAGPVIENHSQTTNLPWVVDGAAIAK
ncbi:MAG: glucokinase, partial [Nitrospirota bacterium]